MDNVTNCVRIIRRNSRNPAIVVIVGGPEIVARPKTVHFVGADAMATSAATAILLAQKLFDVGVSRDLSGHQTKAST